MTKVEAVSLMRGSQTREEWSRNATAIRRQSGGTWPDGFWADLIGSGAFAEFQRRMERIESATVRAVYP